MNWLSAIAAVSKLFSALTGLYRGRGLRQKGAKRLAEITADLDTLGDDKLNHHLRQYQRANGRLRMGKADHRRRSGQPAQRN